MVLYKPRLHGAETDTQNMVVSTDARALRKYRMANASGLFTPTVPTVKSRYCPSLGIYRSGFWFSDGVSRRTVWSSVTQGAEKLSPSESRIPSYGATGKDSLTDLAVEAAKKALQMAGVDPNDVDLVLLCTSTPEDLFGSAPQIQKALGCKNNPLAYDITAACSGFILGLVSAACHIRGKNSVTGPKRACDIEEDGLFAFDMHSDGEGQRHLKATMKENEMDDQFGTNGSLLKLLPKGSSYSCIEMNGKEVFRFAVRVVPQTIESALEKAGLHRSSIDWLLLHQANQRIIDAVATRLEFPSERVISNLANYGNTSAASIPLALDEAVRSGKVQAGHTIATAGFGAGLTWGSAIIRWG
ncbi:hypothetical protein DH2020_014081 [Rehmannia glutinosa]|uniref:Beta-ketoacyl-[acyl-carrier-protein] synthase III C-terminal domain-containing protein n=1 Tax=Rehmannia glutinosa TaxID=99300 RepID=A0ABR0WVX9_REHGL